MSRTQSAGPDAGSSDPQGVVEGGPKQSTALPRKTDFWKWLAHYERFEDRVSAAVDPAARRLFGLAAFMGLWTYWMPDFAVQQEYIGELVVIPIFIYYGIGVGGLSWGIWHLFRERFPWDD